MACARATVECMRGKCVLVLCIEDWLRRLRWALEKYGLILAIRIGNLNPVQRSTGFLFVLQKILCAIRRNVIVGCSLAVAFSPVDVEGGRATKMNKEKNLGQIFTPDYLVSEILDIAGYMSLKPITKKHVIDNSCGDGAFLKEIVRRYCIAARKIMYDDKSLKKDLETYAHGIELDVQAHRACIGNLDRVAMEFSISDVVWDVRQTNTLDVNIYDGRMDYVVGNPPYVRVHNLEGNFDRVKQYSFCSGGMTDLYLVFYEVGLSMLKDGGRLCYIAPSSWFNSLAGHNMREFVKESGWLREVVDLGHFQPFTATTYTAIALFEKSHGHDFAYRTYAGPSKIMDMSRFTVDECYFDNAFYLGDKAAVAICREIKTGWFPEYVDVKNGFATLADDVFIADDFPFDGLVIPVIKASTGKWRKAFFPYDRNGKPLPRDEIFSIGSRSDYLLSKKLFLLKGGQEAANPYWYLYGRTQALKDVWTDKYAINTVVKDVASIKFNAVKAGEGVYSGLYILSEIPEALIREALFSEDFINYLRILRKYKSGGYYTFSSKDLKQFLNYRLYKMLGNKHTPCGQKCN